MSSFSPYRPHKSAKNSAEAQCTNADFSESFAKFFFFLRFRASAPRNFPLSSVRCDIGTSPPAPQTDPTDRSFAALEMTDGLDERETHRMRGDGEWS